MSTEPNTPPATDQLRREIRDLIYRYGIDSNVTVYQAIGVLEIVKLDLSLMLNQELKGQ